MKNWYRPDFDLLNFNEYCDSIIDPDNDNKANSISYMINTECWKKLDLLNKFEDVDDSEEKQSVKNGN